MQAITTDIPSNRSLAWEGFRFPVLTAAFALVALVIHWQGWAEVFQYNRTLLAAGELWRLATCHCTHFHANHLLWDLAAFIGLGWFCEQSNPRGYRVCLIAAALLISLSIWLLQSSMQLYRGLSGIDSALFAFGCVTFLLTSLEQRRNTAVVVAALALLGFVGKIIYEYCFADALFVDAKQSFVVVPLAHLVGGATGIIVALKGGGNLR